MSYLKCASLFVCMHVRMHVRMYVSPICLSMYPGVFVTLKTYARAQACVCRWQVSEHLKKKKHMHACMCNLGCCIEVWIGCSLPHDSNLPKSALASMSSGSTNLLTILKQLIATSFNSRSCSRTDHSCTRFHLEPNVIVGTCFLHCQSKLYAWGMLGFSRVCTSQGFLGLGNSLRCL